MSISYDKKRNDITFCTMLFKIPDENAFGAVKEGVRKFEEFYLPSLEKLIRTFERVALWCDHETADFLRARGLAAQIMIHEMNFSYLPHYNERAEWLKLLHCMKKYIGYLLKHKTPENWIDYMIIINAKPAVVKWAAENDKFNSDYFMWLDAGGFNPLYNRFWENWDGKILAHPKRCRFTVAPTLGRSRPHFLPRFIFNPFMRVLNRIYPILPATAERFKRQGIKSIAMINSDYEVPATSFIIPKQWVGKFYNKYEETRLFIKRSGFVATEQGVFQAMMKLDTQSMFEISYIVNYIGVYAAIAAEKPDHMV